jgi:hypothetical protein
MHPITKFLISLGLTLLLVPPALCLPAQGKVCTEAEAQKAMDESDRLTSWNSAYQFFKSFQHCDDGAIADGYSDAVAKLLAKDWKHLSVLNDLVSKDKDFKEFVFRHIDETADSDDLKAIIKNAKYRCPSGKRALCKSLELKARTSLQSLTKILKQ